MSATDLGAISSSRSFAALATARSLSRNLTSGQNRATVVVANRSALEGQAPMSLAY